MKQLDVKIIENKRVKQGFYRMRLESPYLAKNTRPGQFFEVKCSDTSEPLLRRPLGAHRILKNGIEILYKIVGIGTELLSKRTAGEYLDIIGPLGNGFDIKRTTPVRQSHSRPYTFTGEGGNDERRTAILIAGGIGVAPLVALAEELKKKKNKVVVVIGAKTKSHILCEDEFKSLGCEVRISTEDGSKGHSGLVTDLLRTTSVSSPGLPYRSRLVQAGAGKRTTNNEQRTTIYACGPTAMLKAVAKIAGSRDIPCQVSLEERMACGVGVCLGCPVKIKAKTENRIPNTEYKMICRDGPVFNAEDIAW